MHKIPEKEYRRILEKMPICCVDILIHIGRKFLLVKRLNQPVKGKWYVIGGRVEKWEPLEKAVRRKAWEEAGIKVKIEKFLGVEETMFSKGPFGMGKYHTINLQYLARPIAKDFRVRLDEQSGDYIIRDRVDKTWDPYVKEMIRKSGILKK